MSNTRTILTAEGRRLLNESAAVNGHYWIGHYALAYVPNPTSGDLDRFRTGNDNRLVAGDGQMIFNLWRGDALEDVVAPGYQRDLKRFYRYDIQGGSNVLKVGTTTISGTSLPMPAPLWFSSTAGLTSTYSVADAAVRADIAYLPSNGGYPYVTEDVRGYPKNTAITTNVAAPGVIPVAQKGWWAAGTLGSADSCGRLVSISNYNRSKSPGINRCSGLFQISSFSVVNSTGGSTPKASGIRLGIDLDISPMISDIGWDGGGYSPIVPSPNTPISFKFNRIGIYATKVSRMYRPDSEPVTSYDKVMFDIDSAEPPVLIAVVQWDTPIVLSENGNPYAAFSTTINITLGNTADDSSLVRDNVVFYNASEDESIRYYKNQMLMNAQVLHAVGEQSIRTKLLAERMDRLVTRVSSDVDVYNIEEDGVVAAELVCADGAGGFGVRKIKGEGVGVKVDGQHIVISSSGNVSSVATGAMTSAEGASVAVMVNKNQIKSSGAMLRVNESGINSLEGSLPALYSDIGYKLYGAVVVAPHLTSVNTDLTGTLSVSSAVWYMNYVTFEYNVAARSMLRAIRWSFGDTCPGPYFVVVGKTQWNTNSEAAANAVANDALLPVEMHSSVGNSSGMLFEPIDLVDGAVNMDKLYITIVPKGWTIGSSVSVTCNVLVDQINGGTHFGKFVLGDLSSEFV